MTRSRHFSKRWGGSGRTGEGFLLEVANSGGILTLIGSFYTYDPNGNQIWLIAVGPANADMTSNVTFYINTGQRWGADFDPSAVDQKEFGTGTFTFPACDVGSVTITPNAKYMGLGYTTLPVPYDLSRDITDYKVACPSLVQD